jgi:putative DNA primase/helicase
LFFLALADSGERKTTVDGFFTKAIRQWEAEQEEAHRPVVQAWRAADDAWKAERDGLLTAIREASKRGKDTAELKGKLADLETRKPERPKVPQLLIGDATSEALTWRLAHKWPVGGLLSAEAGVVFGGHAMGRDSIMRNLATLNSLWDAAPMSVERKTSECFTIRAARLSACLAAQPGTVRQWLENCRGLARDSGFLARFLVAQPQSTQGRRMFQEAPEHWPSLSRFHRRLADLLDYPLRFDERGALAPVVLNLDPAAKAAWIEFHDTIEAELAPGGDMAEARDVASKAGDNAARLAALFHVFEHGPAGTVSADDMRRAAGIVAWHLFEARRFLNQIAVPEAVADAMALEAWMIQRCKADHLAALPISLLHKSAPNRLRKKAPLEAALDELESSYRIRRRREGKKIEIEINPEIMEADHGA